MAITPSERVDKPMRHESAPIADSARVAIAWTRDSQPAQHFQFWLTVLVASSRHERTPKCPLMLLPAKRIAAIAGVRPTMPSSQQPTPTTEHLPWTQIDGLQQADQDRPISTTRISVTATRGRSPLIAASSSCEYIIRREGMVAVEREFEQMAELPSGRSKRLEIPPYSVHSQPREGIAPSTIDVVESFFEESLTGSMIKKIRRLPTDQVRELAHRMAEHASSLSYAFDSRPGSGAQRNTTDLRSFDSSERLRLLRSVCALKSVS
jgi:hypothetical protein